AVPRTLMRRARTFGRGCVCSSDFASARALAASPSRPSRGGFLFEGEPQVGRAPRDLAMTYGVIETDGGPIRAWRQRVRVGDEARRQLINIARLPFVFRHVAAMPDVHLGIGATVGSVIPTVGAVIPAAVGVDIGCGMCAVRTSIRAEHLPDGLAEI